MLSLLAVKPLKRLSTPMTMPLSALAMWCEVANVAKSAVRPSVTKNAKRTTPRNLQEVRLL